MLLALVLLAAAPDLTFGGKPVAPSCVLDAALSPEPEPIDLKKCARGKVKHEGATHSFVAGESSGRYRVLGARGADVVVLWQGNTGGSGVFSGVTPMRVEKGRLVASPALWSGDRCNGGVRDAKVDDAIRVTADMTSADLYARLREADPKRPRLELPGSALDCVATVELVVESGKAPVVASFTLDPDALEGRSCQLTALRSFVATHGGPRPGEELGLLGDALRSCAPQ